MVDFFGSNNKKSSAFMLIHLSCKNKCTQILLPKKSTSQAKKALEDMLIYWSIYRKQNNKEETFGIESI